jgi:hypothetical protein
VEQDQNDWPGGHMLGFAIWVRRQWEDFARSLGAKAKIPREGSWRTHLIMGDIRDVDKKFDKWLEDQVDGNVPNTHGR